MRGSACSYNGVPSNRASAQSSFGKWAGTQSRMTPMPAWCSLSISIRKSSGLPNRAVGAKYDDTWYPHEPPKGCSMTGSSSTWVKPRSDT